MTDKPPVPCSDDVDGSMDAADIQHILVGQTGMEVQGSATTILTAAPLETDAEVISGASAGPSITLVSQTNPGSKERDKITLEGKGCTIRAEGLGAALKPGGVFQLGVNNQMTIVQNKGDSAKVKVRKNKYPLTRSTAEPQLKHLDMVSSKLGAEWRRLGRLMGIEDSTLDQIQLDFRAEGQHEINYRMLLKWKQKCTHGQFTLSALAHHMAELGRGDIADEFRNE